MKFIKTPKKYKYFAKGKEIIYHIVKDEDKYYLYSGEYNRFLYASSSLKDVKSVARSIEELFINNSIGTAGGSCAETI